MNDIQVVWFKRDLRVHDHAPLSQASLKGGVCTIYMHEPEIISANDYSAQHGYFIRECLDDLASDLSRRGGHLLEMMGAATDILDQLLLEMPFSTLWSHQETGNAASYKRDKQVSVWCRKNNVNWQQIHQDGVLRGSENRGSHKHFFEHLNAYTEEDSTLAPDVICAAPAMTSTPCLSIFPGVGADKLGRQKGGRKQAELLLHNFLDKRILDYPGAMSSPLTAKDGCSRLSAHLAYGTVSLREIVHAMNRRFHQPGYPTFHKKRLLTALTFFSDRLKWRAGYFQNMENNPSLEFNNIDPLTNGLRENEFNADYFHAWATGKTGFPMIDAAMNMLQHTGWLNMRLRGTVLSFAVNDLWLHWREPMLHLAREFLDYEPAIHWNQAQIHAGTSGATQLLTYNPVKQARDQDPEGIFVRQWLPALRNVPNEHIFEPWFMSRELQRNINVTIGVDYPAPIVDYQKNGRSARARVSAAKKGQFSLLD
jgi:deoxyribodipyrimidine photo-lyase